MGGRKIPMEKLTLTAMERVKNRKALALKLMSSISPVFTDTSWSKEREPREILFNLFEKDIDREIAELAKRERKEYSELTEQFRKENMKRIYSVLSDAFCPHIALKCQKSVM